jgi:hypothetical protein
MLPQKNFNKVYVGGLVADSRSQKKFFEKFEVLPKLMKML